MTSVLCLLYHPETVHCSTKDAYTSEITFLALKPWVNINKLTLRWKRIEMTGERSMKSTRSSANQWNDFRNNRSTNRPTNLGEKSSLSNMKKINTFLKNSDFLIYIQGVPINMGIQ